MFKPLGKIACIITIISLLDGYSLIFQTIIWGSMLNDRIPEQGIELAVMSTFSGETPCKLCLNLEKVKQEKKIEDNLLNLLIKKKAYYTQSPNDLSQIGIFPPAPKRIKYSTIQFSPKYSLHKIVTTPPPDLVV